MKTENLTQSLISVTGTVLGAGTSRIIADKIPIKKTKLKHALLAGVAITGACFLDRKEATSAFVQDVAIGVAATQVTSLVKELMGDKLKEGILKTGLGNYTEEYEPVNFLAYNNYDFIPAENYTETPFEKNTIEFRK